MRALDPTTCAELMAGARSMVALTGAGISTAAGIPDFRGPEGLYATGRYDPDRVFEIAGFLEDPEPFFDFTRDLLAIVDRLQPTFTHRFLAELEAGGRLRCVVTQNIDPLHQRAGSERVVAVHGGYWTSHCMACGTRFTFDELRAKVVREPVPRCVCGGVIKPDVVFFGEPVHGLDEAAGAVARADLLLVLGSSLTVFPAAMLPEYACCPVVVVNRGEVGLRPGPERYFADADLDEFFREVAEHLA